jgi:hypothetical protein
MKSTLALGVAATLFITSLGIAALSADQRGRDDDDVKDARARIGLRFAREQNIPINVVGRDRESIGLGSYLVNAAGGCNDCHTAPPFLQDPFAFLGAPKQLNVPCYLGGGTPFGPGVVSRDITPFERNRPAGLTFKQFLHVLRTGEDPDNPGHVLQVMPWPVYQEMATSDLRAIYDFLSAIPPVEANTCGVPSEPEEQTETATQP